MAYKHFKGLRILFYLTLFSLLFIVSCSQNIEEDKSEDGAEAISGYAVSNIYQACKYSNGSFCDQKCCVVDEKCDSLEYGYKECGLETGEWKNTLYQDVECLLECGQAITVKHITPSDEPSENMSKNEAVQIALNDINKSSNQNLTSSCSEGWKCVETKYRGYYSSNCSWTALEYCSYKCEDGECKPAPFCTPNSLKCNGKILEKCSADGSEWVVSESCAYDCEHDICVNETNPEALTNKTAENDDYIANKCIIGNVNATDEFFTLNNICSYLIDMTNWTAKDASIHTFTFPSFTLGIDSKVTAHTGSGTDNLTDLYWGRGSSVWNNDKDTLYLNNSKGVSVLVYSYP